MTTRHTSATPAPAPAPAPALQSSEPSQPASAEQKVIPPLSEPTTSNPPPNAPVKTNDPPSPARVASDAAAPLPSQPSGTPYGTIGSSNESSNRIMLTVSLVVVFVVLAGMGLVVYCLFRRRTAKRRMHLFGGNGGSKNASGSLDSSAAAGNSGIGSGGKRKSMTAHRQSTITLGGGSIIGTGGKGDPMTTALAEMQEQQRRISDGDMSRALQAMTEKHQNALMTRRSSTLSLGGLHHHNHHQHHLPQNQQHPGSRAVSPNLGPARPHSALGGGYWSGSGGPAGGVDPTGEGSKRATMSGGNTVIGSGDYVAGPLESSPDFRTTLYDDLYYPSPQFLYSSSGGGSSGANSSEQLLPPHHHHHHPHYYNSGPPSSANMSRRSSLSPGAYPTHSPSEMAAQGQNRSPIFRAKTISTSSGQSYQQQMQYQQLYPPHVGSGPHRSTPPPHSSTPPPHLNRMSVPQPPATIASSSDDSSETVSSYLPPQQQQKRPEGASVGVISSDTIPRTSYPLADPTLEHQENHHQPRRPHSMSTLQNNSSFISPHGVTVGLDRSRSPPLMSSSTGNLLDQCPQHRASYDGSSQLIIPPSITTRRRSAMPSALGSSGGVTSPGGNYPYQQGYSQQQHPYGGNGQEYFQDGQLYPISPRSSSPYGYGNIPYQDHRPNHYQYAQQLSSTQMSREPDHQGKSEHTQDGGAGVGVGSSVKTASSSSSSSPGGTSNTASTASTPTPTSVNLNSVRPKSPPPPQVWPSRSNVNGTGSGPIVHIAPALPSSSSSSRASVTAAATGLTILTPVDRESSLAADLHLTEVLDSPTDSSAH
ncbi:hypothetical protein KI688_003055 [Linnemannia hyalina]|uniref:Uncharacterized protein n=1 Tax=Linnemannia hyalina TaxID=64524 RepID=A0A9P8BRA1_9FUNG|nr:hypothetical protein KI688_003055 [Linnemannia hyalina]